MHQSSREMLENAALNNRRYMKTRSLEGLKGKKICMIGTQYAGVPAAKGGAIEWLSFELAKALAGKGAKVTYYSVLSDSAGEKIENLEVKRFPAKSTSGILFNFFVFFDALFKRFDLVYLSGCSMLPSALLLKKIKGLKLFYHEFNHNPWVGSHNRIFDFLSRQSVKSADKVFVLSRFIKKKMLEEMKEEIEEKVFVLPCFVDLGEFPEKMQKKEKKLLFVGRIARHKNIEALVEAMKEISQTHKEWILEIIGPRGEFGEENEKYYNELAELIEKNSLQKNIVFLGRLKRKELLERMANAGIFVFPSSQEAFGLVLLEAMASFTPCIAFESGPVNEIIENKKDGFIVPFSEKKLFAERIKQLIEDEGLRKEISFNARKKAEKNFSLEAVQGKFFRILLEKELGFGKIEPNRIVLASSFLKKGRVLDIGAAYGIVGEHLQENGFDLVSVDITMDSVREASKKGIKAVLCNAEAKNLPFRSNSFDGVWCGEVLEHLVKPDNLVAEARRVLKKDGVLVLSVPNIASLEARCELLFGKVPNLSARYSLPEHLKDFNLAEARLLLEKNKFKIEKVGCDAIHLGFPYIEKIYFNFLRSFFPTLGTTLVIKAVKA